MKDSWGVQLKFPDRTCSNCMRYPCIIGQENCRCDFAKYGCINYFGNIHNTYKASYKMH